MVKNSDVLLRIDSLLSDLYETMQTEEWWNDSNVPEYTGKHLSRYSFSI